MTNFSISPEERRLALQLLAWEERPGYAFAWKDGNVLLVSRTEGSGGDVFEVDLQQKAVKRIGGSGEHRIPQTD